MKETTEFLDALVGTAAQAIDSFKDGAGIDDLPDFIDEAASWPAAIEGFKEGFPREAADATPQVIESMFNGYGTQLSNSGLNPLLVGSIISGMKSAYYTYAALSQKGEVTVPVS